MKRITIENKGFDLICGFRDDNQMRSGFNKLAESTFNFNFEDFYRNGYWGERYLPYAVVDNGRLVANASVNILDFMVLGEQKRFIQIGTVMTDPLYRHMGLSRLLLETIIDEWQGQSELIYLFANDTVLDFYPKFGFSKKAEYRYTKAIDPSSGAPSAVHMDMRLDASRELLFSFAERTVCMGQLGALRNSSLVMFYATSFMSENFYRLPALNAIVCAEYHNGTLHLNDIFCMNRVSINDVLAAMSTKETAGVVLGFTPTDTSGYRLEPYSGEDTLFVMGSAAGIFDSHRLMFPVLSHA